jgi:hypothetical protein
MPSIIILLAIAGCDQAWNAFERVPIGASDIGLGSVTVAHDAVPYEAQESPCGTAYVQAERSVLPLGYHMSRMAYLVDDDGNVCARCYTSADSAWAILAGFAGQRLIVEVRVPSEWVAEPDTEWRPADSWQNGPSVSTAIAAFTAPGGSPRFVDRPPATAVLAIDYALGKLAPKTTTQATSRPQGKNAELYFLAAFAVMDGLHDNVNSRPYSEFLRGLVARQNAFKGITKDGFDCQWSESEPWEGIYWTYRVRNIGGRTIRVEASAGGVFSPLSLFGYGGTLFCTIQGIEPTRGAHVSP